MPCQQVVFSTMLFLFQERIDQHNWNIGWMALYDTKGRVTII